MIVDANDDLYCLWHGNDDYNDFSAAGFINGEFYGAISHDNGATWSGDRNLTNTRSPGAADGACDDEDYMTACPKVVNDSIYLTYIEDKDAGGWPQTEGVMTDSPVRCWVFPKDFRSKKSLTNLKVLLETRVVPGLAKLSILEPKFVVSPMAV